MRGAPETQMVVADKLIATCHQLGEGRGRPRLSRVLRSSHPRKRCVEVERMEFVRSATRYKVQKWNFFSTFVARPNQPAETQAQQAGVRWAQSGRAAGG